MNTTTLAPADKGATLNLAGKRRLREATIDRRRSLGISPQIDADDPQHLRHAIAALLAGLGLRLGDQR